MQDSIAFAPARPEPRLIHPPSRWPTLGARELWRFRDLLSFFAWRELKVRYKQTLLGVVWAALQPVMYMVVFTLFFARFFETTGGARMRSSRSPGR